MHLADNFNPDDIRIPGCEPFQTCGCSAFGDCRLQTCANARISILCDASCCRFDGKCGNGTGQNSSIRLTRIKNTSFLALQATAFIPTGVVLGEGLGYNPPHPHECWWPWQVRRMHVVLKARSSFSRDQWRTVELLPVL
jgi:hypothetical protein